MNIRLSKSMHLPDSVVTGKLAILGRTGSGKTNTAIVMAEQMISAGVPIAILDPQGDWWGLRSKFKIAILGGEHADVPLEPTGGTIAADFVVNERVPVLLDLFKMSESDMVRFATDFAKRLWQTNREALHIFLDEADLFAPQRDLKGPKAACLGAWQNVCRRGRSRGLGLTMITQRSAVLNKDLLTQADPLFVHRLTAPQDLDAVDRYLEYHGLDKQQRVKVLNEVSSLAVGSALVISAGELQISPTVVHVAARTSFNSSATPKPGETVKAPKAFADVDLQALETSMAATIERAKQTDPKALQGRVRELEKQLAAVAQAQPASHSASIDKAVATAVQNRDREWKSRLTAVEKQRDELASKLNKIETLARIGGGATTPELPKVTLPAPQAPDPVKAMLRPSVKASGDPTLGKAERLILIAMYWIKDDQAVTPAKVGFYAGYASGSGSFNNALSNLRKQGLLSGWKLTQEGVEQAASMAGAKPRGPELREWLRPKLSKAENEILDVLIEAGGKKLSAAEIADRTASQYAVGSGSFNNAMSTLRKVEAAVGFDRDGGTAANAVFFE